jgi:nicotinamidase-related amidase
MNRPLRENLEISELEDGAWVQCARCGHRLSAAAEDWREHCLVKRLSPSRMGPHRELMEGLMLLEERYCPGCGVTLDASIIDVEAGTDVIATVRPPRREGRKSTTPGPITLDAASTAVIVLDLHIKACEPSHVGHSLLRLVPDFLDRVRDASLHVLFIVPAWDKGKPEDRIAEPLRRRGDEPVLYPHAYDKFVNGELQSQLLDWGTKTLIFLGGSANFSMLYTATTAARIHGYSVVVPVDGIYAHSDYEMEYALYQFTVLPRMHDKFQFTNLAGIGFR